MRVLALMIAAMLGQASQVSPGVVEGTVYRTGTTEPIENVQVQLGMLALRMNTLTNKAGHFAFTGLAPGKYSVLFQRDGYFAPAQLASAPYSGLVIDVSADPRASTLTLFLTPGGTIAGRVLDPLGRPSVAAVVTAARLSYLEGQPSLTSVKTTTSNDRGEYRLYWLEPGEYFVLAEKNLPTGAARAFFPGTDDRQSALKISVVQGAESANTDFVLRSVRAAVSISGVVTSVIPGFESPPPQLTTQNSQRDTLRAALEVQAAQVGRAPQFYLSPIDSQGIYDAPITVANALTSVQDRASGKFELRNVRPGLYELYAVVQDRNRTPAGFYIAHTTIDVGVQNVDGIALTLAPGIDLKGRVAGDGLPASPLKIALRPNVPLPNPSIAESLFAAVSMDGTFTIPNVPKLRYSVSIGPMAPNTYVSDILQGPNSILDRGTIAVAGGLPDSLEVTITGPAGTIRGSVEVAPPQLASSVAVTLAPEAPRRENLALYRRVYPNADGSFLIGDLTPGNYKLFAWERIPEGAEKSDLFMENYWDSGMAITVAAGRITSAGSVRLIPK